MLLLNLFGRIFSSDIVSARCKLFHWWIIAEFHFD
jgi:hypothetical protein